MIRKWLCFFGFHDKETRSIGEALEEHGDGEMNWTVRCRRCGKWLHSVGL
jgi:hypothetical protein